MRRGKKGFTLMEMLIVVAIIGILVAIAVPVFSHTMEKTKATACAANRRTAKGMIMQAVMFHDGAAEKLKDNQIYMWNEVTPVLEAAGYSLKENLCPSGGTITLDKRNNAYIVVCSEHGEGDAAGMKDAGDILKKTGDAFAGREFEQNADYNFVREYIKQAGGVNNLAKADKDEILKKMGGSANSFGKIAKDEDLVWVGMQVKFKDEGEEKGTAHNILVVTAKNKVDTAGNPGLFGYMFYYNGKYYRSTILNDKNNYDYGNLYDNTWKADRTLADCLERGNWEEVTNP